MKRRGASVGLIFLLWGCSACQGSGGGFRVYGVLFIFVPPSSLRVGWPGSLVSASAMRSSPPSIRAGVLAEHPMLHAS